jgi:hypothetical protein
MNYFRNVWLWLTGLVKLRQLTYKPWCNPALFFPLYLFDYGFNTVFLAGQVVSVSRYCYIRRNSQPWKWLGEVLDRIQPRHIEDAGGPLWGSLENPGWVRIAVPLCWLLLTGWLRYGKWF